MAAKGKRGRDAPDGTRTIAANRKARHDYEIGERFEAGLVLRGSEVKSLREGKASLAEAYATVDENGEAWLIGAHIAEYDAANRLNHPPLRPRKLLLHARELNKLGIKLRERGFTLIPLRLYFKGHRVKLELGLGKGRRSYDKREAIKRRDQAMDLRKELGRRS